MILEQINYQIMIELRKSGACHKVYHLTLSALNVLAHAPRVAHLRLALPAPEELVPCLAPVQCPALVAIVVGGCRRHQLSGRAAPAAHLSKLSFTLHFLRQLPLFFAGLAFHFLVVVAIDGDFVGVILPGRGLLHRLL